MTADALALGGTFFGILVRIFQINPGIMTYEPWSLAAFAANLHSLQGTSVALNFDLKLTGQLFPK